MNFGRMWLVNKLVFTFSAPIKYSKAHFNRIILSRIIKYATYYYYRHTRTDTFVKTVFQTQGLSKRTDLMKISKVIFHIKLIPSHP